MKGSALNILVVLLSALTILSCKKNSKHPATEINGIAIFPRDAFYDKSAQRLIIYSSSGDFILYDLTNNRVIHQVATNAVVGYCDTGTYNGTKELYVPRFDGWLFIYDRTTLKQIDQVKISGQLFSVVYNNGLLFISGENNSRDSVYSYSRATKSKISGTSLGDYLHLKIIRGSNTELFGSSSYNGYYFQFDSAGNHVLTRTTFTSPSMSPYRLSYEPFGVYPDGSAFIATSSGIIVSKALTYVSTLPHGTYSYTSFEFDMANRQIYAGSTQGSILVYSMGNYELAKTINTKGIPQKIFYDNGSVLSVNTVTIKRPPLSDSTTTIIERF